jgi:hypothetical protein
MEGCPVWSLEELSLWLRFTAAQQQLRVVGLKRPHSLPLYCRYVRYVCVFVGSDRRTNGNLSSPIPLKRNRSKKSVHWKKTEEIQHFNPLQPSLPFFGQQVHTGSLIQPQNVILTPSTNLFLPAPLPTLPQPPVTPWHHLATGIHRVTLQQLLHGTLLYYTTDKTKWTKNSQPVFIGATGERKDTKKEGIKTQN